MLEGQKCSNFGIKVIISYLISTNDLYPANMAGAEKMRWPTACYIVLLKLLYMDKVTTNCCAPINFAGFNRSMYMALSENVIGWPECARRSR